MKLKAKFLAWITGAGGLIGNYLVQTAPKFALQWRVRGLARSQLDLTDFDTVRREFLKDKPRLIIHCAAMSSSVACQKEPVLARKINVDATALLAEMTADIQVIFFSTDLVFDGRRGNYIETDAVNPLSLYGETKVAAENIILKNPRHTVIRTSLNVGASPTGDRAFNEQMHRAWAARQSLKFFSDEFRNPIPAVVTARATWELANRNQTGLFHVAGSKRLSRVEIGELFAARCPQLNPKYEVGSLKNYDGAPRSPDTSLNSSKAQKILSFPLPGLREWLEANPHEPV